MVSHTLRADQQQGRNTIHHCVCKFVQESLCATFAFSSQPLPLATPLKFSTHPHGPPHMNLSEKHSTIFPDRADLQFSITLKQKCNKRDKLQTFCTIIQIQLHEYLKRAQNIFIFNFMILLQGPHFYTWWLQGTVHPNLKIQSLSTHPGRLGEVF